MGVRMTIWLPNSLPLDLQVLSWAGRSTVIPFTPCMIRKMALFRGAPALAVPCTNATESSIVKVTMLTTLLPTLRLHPPVSKVRLLDIFRTIRQIKSVPRMEFKTMFLPQRQQVLVLPPMDLFRALRIVLPPLALARTQLLVRARRLATATTTSFVYLHLRSLLVQFSFLCYIDPAYSGHFFILQS